MAVLIRVDGSQEPFTDFTLEGYQKAVADGELIQAVRFRDGSNRVMIMDERGKLKLKKPNNTATIMVGEWLLAGDYIAGDVIIAKTPEEWN